MSADYMPYDLPELHEDHDTRYTSTRPLRKKNHKSTRHTLRRALQRHSSKLLKSARASCPRRNPTQAPDTDYNQDDIPFEWDFDFDEGGYTYEFEYSDCTCVLCRKLSRK